MPTNLKGQLAKKLISSPGLTERIDNPDSSDQEDKL